jgi:hypothetical protein
VSRRRIVRFLVGCVITSWAFVACSSKCPPPFSDHGDPCGDDHFALIEIGRFPSKAEGLRAAIRRLAAETRCPDTACTRIKWIGPSDENDSEARCTDCGRALVYWQGAGTGQARWLGYEHDFLSGVSGRSYLVDRPAIQAVAQKGGTLEDFDQYDRSPSNTR